MTSTFLGYRIYATDYNRSLQRVAAEPTASRDRAYYEANIGKVTTVDQFVNNFRLFTYAMKAYGLEDMSTAKAFMKKVLTSNLSDDKSFANQLSDARYKTFAKAFQFGTKGTVTNNATVQTASQKQDILDRFEAASTASTADKATAVTYFQSRIGSIASVADLEADSKLYSFVKTAYGIADSVSKTDVTKALESDLSDSRSFANTTKTTGLETLAAGFNFTADGKVGTIRVIQSDAEVTKAIAAYKATAGTDDKSKAAADNETAYYQTLISQTENLDDLLANKRIVAFIQKAYGIPTTTTTTQLKAVLSSDPNDLKSTAAKMGDAYVKLAAAFNVTTAGTIARSPNLEAQTKSAIATANRAYLDQTLETDAGDDNEGVRLALYFRRNAANVTDAFSILADPALVKVVQTMLGLSSNSSKADIDSQARNITSKLNLKDLKDPAKVDKLVARFAALYDLTNSSSDGLTTASLFGG